MCPILLTKFEMYQHSAQNRTSIKSNENGTKNQQKTPKSEIEKNFDKLKMCLGGEECAHFI